MTLDARAAVFVAAYVAGVMIYKVDQHDASTSLACIHAGRLMILRVEAHEYFCVL